jgi:hypothetical protein
MKSEMIRNRHGCGGKMASNEEENNSNLMAENAEYDKRYLRLAAWPGSGMSHVHIFLLSRLLGVERKPGERTEGGA